jgi:LasA protease
MNFTINIKQLLLKVVLPAAIILASTGCMPTPRNPGFILPTTVPTVTLQPTQVTAFPQRPHYQPGELVDYMVQSGDTLPVLAVRFNTTEAQIRQANSSIPADLTTLPPGMPMKIPIYYLSLWGPPYQIIPDSLFVDGPAQTSFDTQAFITSHPGWLKNVTDYAFGGTRSAGEIIDYIAINYSVSPRLILSLLDYQAGALSLDAVNQNTLDYPLGYRNPNNKGLYLQLNWAANLLNNGYYSYAMGQLTSFTHLDGTLERPDPWQNPATVALQYYFSGLYDYETYLQTVSQEGLARTYTALFGDPWLDVNPIMPGDLRQPPLRFPFLPGKVWAFTGGPHTNWGVGAPWTSLDFAPPAEASGCLPTKLWATAMADGVIARTDVGIVVLDLDGDGNERTGWVIFYLHMAAEDRVTVGMQVKAGDPIGHPSCEGGEATGTHVHIARKYNGEWIPADGTLAFNLEGWIAHNGDEAYLGTLRRDTQVITACTCSNAGTHVESTAGH